MSNTCPAPARLARGLTLALALVLPVLAVLAALRLNLEENVLAILPTKDEWVDQHQRALEAFHQADRLYFELSLDAPGTARLRQAANALRTELDKRGVEGVSAAALPGSPAAFPGLLPPLFTASDARALDERLRPGAIRDHLQGMRRRLHGHEGYGVKALLANDPVGLSGLVHDKVRPLQSGYEGVRPTADGLLSADGRRLLFWVEPGFSFSDSGRSETLMRAVDEAAAGFRAAWPDIHLGYTGGYRISVDNARAVRRDTLRCTALSVLSIGLVCALAYRRRAMVPLTLLPSLLGMSVAVLALALAFDPVSSIALGLASIAIGVTVDYAIHVMAHLDHSPGRARSLWLPVGVGALTTAAAFAIIAASPMTGYRQLGALGIVGVLVSALAALTLLPAWRGQSGDLVMSARWTGATRRFFAWRERRAKPLLVVAAGVTLTLAAGLTRLDVTGDIESMNGMSAATRADDEHIQKHWGAGLGLSLVITQGDTLDNALRANERATEALARDPGVERVQSLATILPGPETQAVNLARWQTFWNPKRRAQAKRAIATASEELGFRADAFTGFWETVDTPREHVTPDDLADAGLAGLSDGRLGAIEGRPTVASFAKLRDRVTDGLRLRETLRGKAWLVDGRLFTRHIAELTIAWFRDFALWTALAVTAIIYLSFGSWRLTAAMLAPLALGLAATLGAMGWLGVPMTPVNCVFVVFVLGIAEDYAVFLVSSRLGEYRGAPGELAATGGAILLSALTTLLGFGALAAAEHPVLRDFGLTIALGLLLGLAAILALALPLAEWALRHAPALPPGPLDARALRRDISRLYRFFGPYTEHYARGKLRWDPVYARLPEHLPESGLVVDLGCGHGLLEHWIRHTRPGCQLLGVDYDPAKLNAARRTHAGDAAVRFEQADFFEWPFPEANAYVLIDALHYWPPARQAELLEKIHTALCPGGTLLLREAMSEQREGLTGVRLGEKLSTATGHNVAEGLHFLTYQETMDALRAAGFDSIEEIDGAGLGENRLLVALKAE